MSATITAVAPPPPPPPSSGPVTVTVTAPPSSPPPPPLPPSTLVLATAEARPSANTVVIQSPNLGAVILKAPPGQPLPPIPAGAQLLLQALPSADGQPPQMQILAINGRPLPGVNLTNMTLPVGTLSAGTLAATPLPASPIPANPPPVNTAVLPAPNAPLVGGVIATVVRPTEMPVPTTPASAPVSTTPGAASPVTTPAIPAQPAVISGQLPPLPLPVGTQMTLRVVSMVPTPAAESSTPMPTMPSTPASSQQTTVPAPPTAQAGAQAATTAPAATTGAVTSPPAATGTVAPSPAMGTPPLTPAPASVAPSVPPTAPATIPAAAPAAPLPTGATAPVPSSHHIPAMPTGSSSPVVAPSLPGVGTPTPLPAPGLAPTAPTAPSTPTPVVFTAQLLHQSPVGQAVVQSPVGALSLPLPPGLPPGSLITLSMSGTPQPPALSAPAAPEAGRWAALTQLITTMAKDPAQAPLLRMIPQAGPQLAAALAVVSTAVRTGNPRAVFGDSLVRAMERGEKGDIGRQVLAEFQDAANEAARPTSEWRALTLPFVNGGIVDPIRLFLRRPPVDEGDIPDAQKAREGDRFLIDINFSQLGRVQLDGLVKRNDRLFDLILRTDQPLALALRKDIIALFQTAVDTIGIKGSVVFQSGGRWIEIAHNRLSTRLDT